MGKATITQDQMVPMDAANPAGTTAGANTAFRFVRRVNKVVIQNNTAAIVNVNFDATATAGSFVLAANGTPQTFYLPCIAVNLLTAGAQSVNGNTASGIVVAGAD